MERALKVVDGGASVRETAPRQASREAFFFFYFFFYPPPPTKFFFFLPTVSAQFFFQTQPMSPVIERHLGVVEKAAGIRDNFALNIGRSATIRTTATDIKTAGHRQSPVPTIPAPTAVQPSTHRRSQRLRGATATQPLRSRNARPALGDDGADQLPHASFRDNARGDAADTHGHTWPGQRTKPAFADSAVAGLYHENGSAQGSSPSPAVVARCRPHPPDFTSISLRFASIS
jgi:hypothetical protein